MLQATQKFWGLEEETQFYVGHESGQNDKAAFKMHFIYIYIYIYIYIVNKDSEYPKNECSMHIYLIQNIHVEQDIYFCLKKQQKKKKNSIWIPSDDLE